MKSFIFYDLIFLVIFGILAGIFFNKNKKNVKRHGWIFLYHSKFGINAIDWIAKKFEKILKPMSYLVISLGYVLMAGILWLLSKSVWIYVTTPIPEQLKNLPPIAPLIPYFPRLFNLESVFPPLYFTYFLVALAIVAISHEASHGIFARLWKIKVKTTGLAFFGPFFGAFVEPDEKKMAKAPKFHQLSILGAGVFANIIMFLLFGMLLIGFFMVSYTPAGINFNAYSQSVVNVSDIVMVGTTLVSSASQIPQHIEEGLNLISTNDGKSFLLPGTALTDKFLSKDQIVAFDNAPAINVNLEGAIISLGGEKIRSHEDLVNTLGNLNPGETIKIVTIQEGAKKTYELDLDDREGNAFLGIGFYDAKGKGLVGKMQGWFAEIKNPYIYYETTWDGDFVKFIYDLLWWIIVINILVALFNMLPVSILDGGRFFYLTIWRITGSEKIGKKAYKAVTWFILFLVAAMMAKWVVNII